MSLINTATSSAVAVAERKFDSASFRDSARYQAVKILILRSFAAMKNQSDVCDTAKEHCLSPAVLWVNRFALFLIYFWFGFLKIISASPAEQLITHLHQITLYQFISIDKFLIALGAAECVIGVLWLVPKMTKYALVIFLAQIATTFLPLVVLPEDTWQNAWVLSLTGQYIFKNVVLIACAFTIYKDCQVRGWKFL